jgi:hypothetical protein
MTEVTKMRQWLTEFKTLVENSIFSLQVVEGILYPYLNVQDETKYLKYITGEEFGNISSSAGNFAYLRYTDQPMRYQQNKLVEVDLVLVAGLPFCKNVNTFANLIVQQLQAKLVTVGDIEVQTNMIEVFKDEVSEDSTKMKTEYPLVSVAFTILVPQSNVVCRLDDLDCNCQPSMIMSC